MKKVDLVFKRVFDAPVKDVWQLWVDHRLVMKWWGPDRFTCPMARIDFREGGTSIVSMFSPEFGQSWSTWDYQKIVPLQRIVYIHNLVDEDGKKIDPKSIGMPPDFPQDLMNIITFKSLGPSKTEMTVTEMGWPPGQMMEFSKMGMEQCIEKMAKALTAR